MAGESGAEMRSVGPDRRLVGGRGHPGGVTTTRELVDQLLDFPSGNPYAKWTGTHWRLVEIADSGVAVDRRRVQPGVQTELDWLLPYLEPDEVLRIAGRVRRHGSIEGNAVY